MTKASMFAAALARIRAQRVHDDAKCGDIPITQYYAVPPGGKRPGGN